MRVIRLRVLLVLCLVTIASGAAAQTQTDQRVWLTFTVQPKTPPKSPWRWVIESYLRTRDGVDDVDVAAVRPTISYNLNAHSSIGGGYGFVTSFPAAGGTTIEHRLFQQYVVTSPWLGGTFLSRTRFEERFVEGNSGPVGRLRQQVRFSHPLRKGGKVSLIGYDEFFVHVNDTTKYARGIDQNRAFAGVGVTVNARARFEAGYLNAFSPGHNGAADKRYHVLSGLFVLGF